MLYQYLDIKDNEKKKLSKLIFNKQNIILILIAILFSPMVIGVRFICCKIDKIENRKIKAVIKVIGFVVFSSYLVSLKENVAYLLIGIFSLVYLLYQFYLSGLETKWFASASLRQAIIHEIPVCKETIILQKSLMWRMRCLKWICQKPYLLWYKPEVVVVKCGKKIRLFDNQIPLASLQFSIAFRSHYASVYEHIPEPDTHR